MMNQGNQGTWGWIAKMAMPEMDDAKRMTMKMMMMMRPSQPEHKAMHFVN